MSCQSRQERVDGQEELEDKTGSGRKGRKTAVVNADCQTDGKRKLSERKTPGHTCRGLSRLG